MEIIKGFFGGLKFFGMMNKQTQTFNFECFCFRVILFNAFWKFLRRGNSVWDSLELRIEKRI